MKFSTTSHSVFNLKAHIVFVVAYRRKAISPRILSRLTEVFEEVCRNHQAFLIECSGEADHVHLLVEYRPTIRISDFIRSLKAVSSQKVRKEFHKEIRHLLWGKRFWTKSYCVISVGDGATTDIIEQYIRNQIRPK